MSNLLDFTSSSTPFPEMLAAIKCIRAHGLKTALLTNNWFLDNTDGKSITRHDLKSTEYFDVVGYFFFSRFLLIPLAFLGGRILRGRNA